MQELGDKYRRKHLATGYQFSMNIINVKDYLERTYASNVTVEFEHIKDENERLWLYDNYEKAINTGEVTKEEKIKALQLLVRAE